MFDWVAPMFLKVVKILLIYVVAFLAFGGMLHLWDTMK